MISPAELSRYGRQLVLPEIGIHGQERLRNARVLVVGAGGLGSPVALYLAAAGVGTIGIVDDDVVESSNLHRQILHGTPDIGVAKSESASNALHRLNPHVQVRTHQERLTRARAETLCGEYDLVVDGSDNYETRYAVNDACARLKKPWIYGSVERFSGQVSVFGAEDGPCYRCLYPEAPSPGTTASCEEIGVLGAVPGVIGSLQAVEALKWIAKVGEPLIGRLLQLDLKRGDVRIVRFDRRVDCPACAMERDTAMGESNPEAESNELSDLEPAELLRMLERDGSVQLIDLREPWEWAISNIPRARLLPLSQLESDFETLDRSREVVVLCHHGVRSGMAAEWLRALGFRARNVVGGIDRWSRDVDPSTPRY